MISFRAHHLGVALLTALALAASASRSQSLEGTLEVPAPNSTQSGIGAISGWHCTASRIDISIDGGPVTQAGSHTSRNDTLGVCGRADTGFSLLFNWNTLPTNCFGCRFHRIVALADGIPFANAEFQAENFGTEFLTGKVAQYDLPNFPDLGSTTTLRWDESRQNFSVDLVAANQISLNGIYFGAIETGAHNPACGPFPPGNVLPTKLGGFTVTLAGGSLALLAQYADGSSCAMQGSAASSAGASADGGYLNATFDAVATASCPEFPGGLDLRVNGQRLVATARDNCRSARVVAAK
jgi:hypothetical protein